MRPSPASALRTPSSWVRGGGTAFSRIFPQLFENSDRAERQRRTPIQVIIGNPPYSVGQKSANDNAQNQSYPMLEKRLAETYVTGTHATNKKLPVRLLHQGHPLGFRQDRQEDRRHCRLCLQCGMAGRKRHGWHAQMSGRGVQRHLCLQSAGQSAHKWRTVQA